MHVLLFMHQGELLQNRYKKKSVWVKECGNTAQCAAINEGMRCCAAFGAKTAAQVIFVARRIS